MKILVTPKFAPCVAMGDWLLDHFMQLPDHFFHPHAKFGWSHTYTRELIETTKNNPDYRPQISLPDFLLPLLSIKPN